MGLLRRTYSAATLALALCSVAQAHRGTRKSLNFAPPHPDAYFYTTPMHILDSRDPYKVAEAFLKLYRAPYPTRSFVIRKDSYTDEKTGVTHIFARQLVGAAEVADGDINLNIRDGWVLSYGNSFYAGPEENSTLSVPNWHQAVYCAEPTTSLNDHACGSTLDRVQAIASLRTFDPSTCHSDPRAAVFFFLQAAHPDPTSLALNFDSFQLEPRVCTEAYEEPMWCAGWAVSGVANGLPPVIARSVLVQTPALDGTTRTRLNPAWRLEVTLPDNQYEAYVSAHDPTKIIAVTDWVVDAPTPDEDGWLSTLQRHVFGHYQNVLDAQDPLNVDPKQQTAPVPSPFPSAGKYRVWKWGINDPEGGKRTLEVEPKDRTASPLGWHSFPAANDPLREHPELGTDTIVNYTTTIGNNVLAQANWDSGDDWKDNHRPNGGPDLTFDFPYGADPSQPGWQTVEPRQYVNTSVTQLFYLANMYHDLLYHYGFDEVSGNFQQYNFGKGAAEGDAVIVDAQDSGGFNNANFMTPPDGQNGRCRMYLWNTAKPFRDGGLDAGILIHELSHGLSTRLTGGPRSPACLETREAGGMGEGWGDFIATLVRSTSATQEYPMGAWAANAKRGIRHFPYTPNITANPSMYDYLQRVDYREVHAIGEVWGEILYAISSKLIDKHGFADSLFPSSTSDFYRAVTHKDGRTLQVPKHGNTLMLQLVVNGMKTQPCRPTLIQARDAILAADKALTDGENACLLWSAFASRGLGTDAKKLGFATRPSINGFKVPPECK